jgi:arginine decarboxylase
LRELFIDPGQRPAGYPSIRAADLDAGAIRAKIAASPLLAGRTVERARLAVVTNSTYDGTMYDTGLLVVCLGQVAEHVLLDEACIPYAAFHPVYAGHFGMAAGRDPEPGVPTVITTMSTHKMLAALSQASMIHIRQGRAPLHCLQCLPALARSTWLLPVPC